MSEEQQPRDFSKEVVERNFAAVQTTLKDYDKRFSLLQDQLNRHAAVINAQQEIINDLRQKQILDEMSQRGSGPTQ